ncbi:MAG: hypothetical protein HOY75_10720 [Streptomyces sp.]|nr:hypothetical protein [Streptomyces sp.]
MSTTPNTAHPTTAHDRPDPNQLTGAAAAVWAALNTQPGATSATLAQAAGAGRSTTAKALHAFEQKGLARREASAAEGSGRPINYWYAIPAPDNDANSSTDTPDEPSTENIAGPEAATPCTDDSTHAAEPPTCRDDTPHHNENGADEPDANAEQARHESQSSAPDEAEQEAGTGDTLAPTPALTHPAQRLVPAEAPEAAQPTAASGGEKVRLAPGALRQMVIDHLNAHPTDAFTATRISRIIGKSSGAIANALATLTKQGIAEQVIERPRTYRLATAPASSDA